MKNSVLILGSKPPGKIPKIEVQEVFSSNGSAELASLYTKKVKQVSHTCIIGAESFTKLEHIKTRVINSEPNEIVIRDYKEIYSYIPDLFKIKLKTTKFTKKEQLMFQKIYFNKGLIDILIAELNYEEKFINKIIHILRGSLLNNLWGVSSGFFALLYAAKKYPYSNLIVSGLSFEGGEHYYKQGKMTDNRGKVDGYLFKLLKKQIKDRIFIFDKEISKKLNVKNLVVDEILQK